MAYTDLTTTFEHAKRLDWDEFDELAENDAYKHLVATTKAVFHQAAAPTNWTKSTAVDDSALRVVSGATGGSTGGTKGYGTQVVITHSHTVDAHQHGVGDHQHHFKQYGTGSCNATGDRIFSGTSDGDYVYWSAGAITSARRLYYYTKTDGNSYNSGNASVDTTDSQLTSFTFSYVDVIDCAKDASTYTDLTAEFDYQDLTTWQLMDTLAENDADDHLAQNTGMAFFQATAPTNWVKSTTDDQAALRVVSGAGGGSSAGTGTSSGFTINHSHTATTHTHALTTHIHVFDYSLAYTSTLDGYVCASDGDSELIASTTATSGTDRRIKNVTLNATSTLTSGTTAPGTDSQLANVVLKYFNCIVCIKGDETYTDMTAEFEYMDLHSWINMDALAESDAYDMFPSGTDALFTQASAPTGWTKQVAQDDRLANVVSDGSGGGTGGTQSIASSVTIAHTHTVNSHLHTRGLHVHEIDYGAGTVGAAGNIYNVANDFLYKEGGTGTSNKLFSRTEDGGGGEGSGNTSNAAPETDSQLTNFTFKYMDAIVCAKDA